MPIHEIHVSPTGEDPRGRELRGEVLRTLGEDIGEVRTTKVYRLEGVDSDEADRFAREVLSDPVAQTYAINPEIDNQRTVSVAYKPGVMNPESESIVKAAHDSGVNIKAADSLMGYTFESGVSADTIGTLTTRLLVNKTVQEVVTGRPDTLLFDSEVGPVEKIPIREASDEELMKLSRDKLFLNLEEMKVAQRHFQELNRNPTDVELEIIAARWSEHCGHKTFNAKVMVDGVEKAPLFTRIKEAAREHFGDLVISAFDDNSGVIRFYDGQAICGKVETHNRPSAVEPKGGAMTGSGGVFRDIQGTAEGAETIISTDMFCFAPPDIDESFLPPGTLHPDYIQRKVVEGVRDYGNRMGIPTANGSTHFHPDFRANPSVIVGGYGILPESRAEKGKPRVGDLVVAIGGRTGRDGIHGATFSSGEMTDRTARVNSSAVQIGNAIEEKRMFDALIEARDSGLIRAITDCGAAGFSSAIGEMGEGIGVTVDISKAPLKYSGLAPWEIFLSESQERMVLAVSPENIEQFLEISRRYNVESAVLGEFDGSHTLTVNYGEQNVAELDYDFLENGLPQRVMEAHWERTVLPEIRPELPANEQEWIDRFKAVLAHGNVCSKEPVVRQYDHGVQGGNIVAPYGGINQDGPNDALVIRPILDKPYGVVQSHGLNPILNRIDPAEGTKWAFAEAAANYVAVGGDINEAAAVGNYIWPFPDKEEMGSLDRSVDAAVEMMHTLELPVISGKDSLSSTYRGKNGEVIKIPPVYELSIFGRIPDVEKTMTSDIKQPGSTLVVVGELSTGMAGSTYYDIAGGSSNELPHIDTKELPQVLKSVQAAVASGEVLSCHDVSEGGVATTVAEMCFGGDCGAELEPQGIPASMMDTFLFNETAGCFVVEVPDRETAKKLFGDVPHRVIGTTTADKNLQVRVHNDRAMVFDVDTSQLKQAWQAPMKEVFHS